MFYGRSVPADDSFRPVAGGAEELEGPQIRDGLYKVKPAGLLTERGAVRWDADLVLSARISHVLCNRCAVRFVLEAKYDYPGAVARIPPVFKTASMPSGTHCSAPESTGHEIKSDSEKLGHSGPLWPVSAPWAPEVHQTPPWGSDRFDDLCGSSWVRRDR